MPITVVCLTEEEYQVLLDRLKALEDAKTNRLIDLAPVLQRLQGIESTLSALTVTAANLPAMERRVATLERGKGPV